MGNEAWLILLARGHKQSVRNQRRRKHNPSGPTSCCIPALDIQTHTHTQSQGLEMVSSSEVQVVHIFHISH